jgi:hypothetical protein
MDIIQAKLTDLTPYPHNPRKGNVSIIAESLEAYGQYKPITVNKRNNQILAGNHTYQAAQTLGWKDIAVVFVDVDEVTAAKIVAIDNRASDSSVYDNEILLELLGNLPTLEGTGYDNSDLDDLVALLEEAETPTVAGFTEPKVGTEGNSNAVVGVSLADYAERYAQKASRMLVADFPNDTYVWLMDKLVDYRTKNDIVSNADAIIHLIETEYGEKAPTL